MDHVKEQDALQLRASGQLSVLDRKPVTLLSDHSGTVELTPLPADSLHSHVAVRVSHVSCGNHCLDASQLCPVIIRCSSSHHFTGLCWCASG